MSAKAKPQPTEIDHIRDTLTDVIHVLGQTRGEMHQRFDQQEERFDQQDKELSQFKHHVEERFDCLEKKVDQQSSEIGDVKEMLQVLLSRQ